MGPPKEYSKEFHTLTKGSQPSQLDYKTWRLKDDRGCWFDGIITHDVQAAPRKITFGHREIIRSTKFKLEPENVIQPAQIENTFSKECTGHIDRMKNYGCKVTTIAEILQRKKAHPPRSAGAAPTKGCTLQYHGSHQQVVLLRPAHCRVHLRQPWSPSPHLHHLQGLRRLLRTKPS